MMLSLDTAYRSFGGEVEASSTPTICRLSDSRRHQLSAIAPWYQPLYRCGCLIGYDAPVSRSGAGMTRPSFLGVLLIGAADKRHVFGSLIRQRFAAIVLPGDRP